MKQPKTLILTLLIGLILFLCPGTCYAQSGSLQTSTQWTQTSGALVQKAISVSEERAPSASAANEIVVKFKAGVSPSAYNAFNSQLGVTVIKVNASAKFMRVRIPSGSTINDIVNAYRQNVNVLYAEPVYYFKSKFVPDDEKYEYQWNLYNPYTSGINMQKAWDITLGSPNVIVAIVDTGVAYESYYDQTNYYYKARDFSSTNFVEGYDFVNEDKHANDDHWHGTFIAGIIAHTTNNNFGGAGVAPHTSIMPIKVLDKEGHGSTFLIAEGIVYAADHGAKVINLSLGGPEPSLVLEDACAYAYKKGVTIVCAAGNRGMGSLVYPAAYNDYCIAVGATRLDGSRAYYSDFGEGLDIVAPGGDVQVDQNRDKIGDGVMAMTFGPLGYNNWVYLFAHGTSMAAAHVSGVAALIISRGIANTPADVREVLQKTASARGVLGYDYEYGWGQVDAYAALMYQSPSQSSGSTQTDSNDTSSTAGDEDASTTSTQDDSSSSTSDIQISGSTDTAFDDSTDTAFDDSTNTDSSPSEPPSTPLSEVEMEVAAAVQPVIPLLKNEDIPDQARFCGCYNSKKLSSPNSAYSISKKIFVGKVIVDSRMYKDVIVPGSNLQWKKYWRRYKFQVLKNYKGVSESTIDLFDINKQCIDVEDPESLLPVRWGSPGTCESYKNTCSYPFTKGETYLIYTDTRMINICHRILPIEEAGPDFGFLNLQ